MLFNPGSWVVKGALIVQSMRSQMGHQNMHASPVPLVIHVIFSIIMLSTLYSCRNVQEFSKYSKVHELLRRRLQDQPDRDNLHTVSHKLLLPGNIKPIYL